MKNPDLLMAAQPAASLPARAKKPRSARADWLICAGLIALSAVPVIAGSIRLTSLLSGAEVTPENARFFAMPLPVVLHILCASLFSVLGAVQFAPRFRRRWPGWHRHAGRLLVICGMATALSGLWMTLFYPGINGPILLGFRLVVGSAMALSIALSLAAILRRNVAGHRAWMTRGYALGQGAGTQVLVMVAWLLIFGAPGEVAEELLMGAAWIINVAVAEWIIRK